MVLAIVDLPNDFVMIDKHMLQGVATNHLKQTPIESNNTLYPATKNGVMADVKRTHSALIIPHLSANHVGLRKLAILERWYPQVLGNLPKRPTHYDLW